MQVPDILKIVGKELTRSMHEQPEQHFFEETFVFERIMELKDKKFVTHREVVSACAECSEQCQRTSFIEQHLKLLQAWVGTAYASVVKFIVVVKVVNAIIICVLYCLLAGPDHLRGYR